MRHLLPLLVLLLAACAGGLVGEEGGGFGELGKDGDAGKKAKSAPAAKDKPEGTDKTEARKTGKAETASPVPPVGGSPEADKAVADRGGGLGRLRDYCKERNLAIAETTGKCVRLLLIGGVNADAKMLVEHADLALTGLETWTGQSGVFARDAMPAEEIYTLAIFPDAGTRDAYIDRGNSADAALAKKCGAVSFLRGNFTDPRILPIAKWWAVFATARSAIDAFYMERGQKPQVWLREGLACELQRLICEKQVRMYSIAYQENSTVKLDGDWAKDVAKMIETKNQLLVPASSVMLMDVVGIPGEHYKQMWSLSTWLRGMAKSQKGGDNKLLKLFAETARGTPARDAVKAVYALEDPPLTQGWLAWAAQAK